MKRKESGVGDVLVVDDLTICAFGAPRYSAAEIVHGVSFTMADGERVALVGASGSGKSLTIAAILGMLPAGLTASGQVTVAGVSSLGSQHGRRVSARSQVGAVFQDPRSSLNPACRVESQLLEPLRSRGVSRDEAVQAALDLLSRLDFDDPAVILRRYPGQLSGGQRQRIAIAVSLIHSPRLLIADEPTSSLDTAVQASVMSLLRDVVGPSALLFITHDIAAAAALCDRVIVMHDGRIVDQGPLDELLSHARHEHTQSLIAATHALSLQSIQVRLP